jgi:hypothetical protein
VLPPRRGRFSDFSSTSLFFCGLAPPQESHMALVWQQQADGWVRVSLAPRRGRGAGRAASLDDRSARSADDRSARSADDGSARSANDARPRVPMPPVMSFEAGEAPAWALVVPSGLTVFRTGSLVALHLAVLADRDELLVVDEATGAKQRFFFSTEAAPLIEPAPVALTCPRCKDPLISGAPAVCCPTCRAWHHQTDERPCWTYSDFCAACPAQRTALDGRLSWTPEEL